MTASSTTQITTALQGIKALCEKATKGPWHVESEDVEGEFGSGPDTMSGYKSFFVEDHFGRRICDSERGEHSVEVEWGTEEDCGSAWDETGKRNLAFIAASRETMEKLVKALEHEMETSRELANGEVPRISRQWLNMRRAELVSILTSTSYE